MVDKQKEDTAEETEEDGEQELGKERFSVPGPFQIAEHGIIVQDTHEEEPNLEDQHRAKGATCDGRPGGEGDDREKEKAKNHVDQGSLLIGLETTPCFCYEIY